MFLALARRMVRTGATMVLEKIWGHYEMGYKQAWFIRESGKAVREDHMSLLLAFLFSKAVARVQGDSVAKERAAELEAKADILLEEVLAKQTSLDSAMAQHEEQARSWVAQLDAISSALEAKISAVAEREAACAAKGDDLKQRKEEQAARAADLQAQSIELTAARRRLEEDKAALQQRADAVAAEESAARAAKEAMEASAAALQLREAKAEVQSSKLATARRRLEEEKTALQQRADAVTAKESAARAAQEEAEAKEKEKEAAAKKKAEAQYIKLGTARRRLEEDKTALQQRADAVAAEESAAKAAKKEVEASAAALQLREAMAQEAETAIKEQEARAAQLLQEAQAEKAAAGRAHAAAEERASADLRQRLDALTSAQQQEIARLEEAKASMDSKLQETRAEVDSAQAQLAALRTEICANKAEAQQVVTMLAAPPGLAVPDAAAAEHASVQQADAQAAKPMQTRPQPQRMQQVKSASTPAQLPVNSAPPPVSTMAASSKASAAAIAPLACKKSNQQDSTASKATCEEVITRCAPPPGFAEPKTAAAKQASCQQAADQAADFAWLGIKLKSSQTPGRQAQRTQQVDDSASKATRLPTKTATPPSSAVAASPDAPAATPALLASKKANQQDGTSRKATIAEVVMCAPPPGLAVPKASAAAQACAQQAAAQAAKPMQTRPQPQRMQQVTVRAPPPGFAQPKAAAAKQASAQQAAPQAGKPEQAQRQAKLMPQSQINLNTAPDKGKLRQEASQAVPPMAPQLSNGQDGQASIISSKTAKSAEQSETKAVPEHTEGDDSKEQKERPAVKGRKARQGAKKRAERAAQAASIPGAAPLRPDSSATAMAGRVQLKAATAVRPWAQQQAHHATPAEARMVQSLTLGLENGGGLFNPEGCDMATRTGHNACFANASMQVLYHTAPPALRALLIALHPASIQHPVVHELQQLFVAMADSGRPSADTRGLRKALHDADGKKFGLGCPCSASETMTFLLDLLHKEPACRSAVQRVFGCEAAHSCATCGKCFDFRDAWQLYCQSSAVPASAKADTGLEASLAALLRQPLSSYRCCGQTVQPTLVSRQPQVMVATLGVNADAGGAGTEQAGVHDLASIISNLKTLRQALDLGGIYRGVEGGQRGYRLQGLVCHHSSKHYVAYVRLQDLWVRMDDSKVTVVGTLEHVMDECCSYRMQPEVAAFEAM